MNKSKIDRQRDAIRKACEAAGGQVALATKLGISQSAVAQWIGSGNIPPARVPKVEKITGVSRHELRPDIFDAK